MSRPPFDPNHYIQRLVAAGMTQRQAEVWMEMVCAALGPFPVDERSGEEPEEEEVPAAGQEGSAGVEE